MPIRIQLFILFLFAHRILCEPIYFVSEVFSELVFAENLQLIDYKIKNIAIDKSSWEDDFVVIVDPLSNKLQITLYEHDKILDDDLPDPFLSKVVSKLDTLLIELPKNVNRCVVTFSNYLNKNMELSNFEGYVKVFRVGSRPEEVKKTLIRDILWPPVSRITKKYLLPDFYVSISPCGKINAFSKKGIIVCSELIADLHKKDMPEAIQPIILHELAHTILELLNFPGSDNEELADEFAAIWSDEIGLSKLYMYLSQSDPLSELILKMYVYDKHQLSKDRIIKMYTSFKNKDMLQQKWNNLLKAHLRKNVTE